MNRHKALLFSSPIASVLLLCGAANASATDGPFSATPIPFSRCSDGSLSIATEGDTQQMNRTVGQPRLASYSGSTMYIQTAVGQGLSMASTTLGAMCRSDGVNSISWISNSQSVAGNIKEMSGSGTSWSVTDMSTYLKAPAALDIRGVGPSSHVRSDGVNSIVYLGNDHHIYEMFHTAASGWHYGDLTKINNATGKAAPASAPMAYTSGNGEDAVVYVGTDSHIYEMRLINGAWEQNTADLTKAVTDNNGAPPLVYDKAEQPVGVRDAGGTKYVAYRCASGADAHVCVLYVSGNRWWSGDLNTYASGALANPAMAPLSTKAAYVRHDNVLAIVYSGPNNHVEELSLNGSWGWGDLTAWFGAPTTNSKSSAPAGIVVTNDHGMSTLKSSVIYLNSAGGLSRISFNGSWSVDPL